MKLTGWGRYPVIDGEITTPETLEELLKQIKQGNTIARGNGRSYGDSSISKRNTISMKKFNKMIDFNNQTGLLTVEAGVLLSEVINTFLPNGWFPIVTPGTKYVTIGGMVASDVHGKNHYKEGGFGNYIDSLDLINSDSNIVHCSRKVNSELFNWTIGGMGLTGVILRISFYLRHINSSWIIQKNISSRDIDNTIEIFEKYKDKSTYSVAWIDCLSKGKNLGKSVIMLGDHYNNSSLKNLTKKNVLKISKKKKLKIPYVFPSFFLNTFIVKAFNYLYYLINSRKKKDFIVNYDQFFYPLDALIDWNKIYGPKGFAQFQCVIPIENAKCGMRELLNSISKSGAVAFLAVLKRFGNENSFFSFPMEGYSLALDFPINKKSLKLMNQLDEITIKYKGRFYLTKDSRMKKETFQHSEKRFKEFIKFRSFNKLTSFQSSQSERLGL